MEPDEHLLNLSEKGRVEIANEVQPQRRAGLGRAGLGSQALRERIIHLAAAQCFFPTFVVLFSFNPAEMFEQKVVSQEEERQFYIKNDVLNLNFNPRKSGNEFLETQKCKITSKSLKI